MLFSSLETWQTYTGRLHLSEVTHTRKSSWDPLFQLWSALYLFRSGFYICVLSFPTYTIDDPATLNPHTRHSEIFLFVTAVSHINQYFFFTLKLFLKHNWLQHNGCLHPSVLNERNYNNVSKANCEIMKEKSRNTNHYNLNPGGGGGLNMPAECKFGISFMCYGREQSQVRACEYTSQKT